MALKHQKEREYESINSAFERMMKLIEDAKAYSLALIDMEYKKNNASIIEQIG